MSNDDETISFGGSDADPPREPPPPRVRVRRQPPETAMAPAAPEATPITPPPPARVRVRKLPASAPSQPGATSGAQESPETPTTGNAAVNDAPAPTQASTSNPEEPNDGYKVGYKNPPKHTQFKPNNNANPKGRPRTKDFWDHVESEMAAQLIARIDGRQVKLTGEHAAAKGFAAKVVNGDPRALDRYVKRIERQQHARESGATAAASPPLTDKQNAQIDALLERLNGKTPSESDEP